MSCDPPSLLKQVSFDGTQTRLLRSGSDLPELVQALACEAGKAAEKGGGLGPASEGKRRASVIKVNATGEHGLRMFSTSPPQADDTFAAPTARSYDSLHQYEFHPGGNHSSGGHHLQDPGGPIPDLWDLAKGEGDYGVSNHFPTPPGSYQQSAQPMFPAHFPSLYHAPLEAMQGQGGSSALNLALPPAVPASWYGSEGLGNGSWRGLGPGHELPSSSLMGAHDRRLGNGAPLPSLQARHQHSSLLARDPLHLALEEGALSLPPAVPPFRSSASAGLLEDHGRAAARGQYLPHRASPGGVRKPPSPGNFRPHSSSVRGVLPPHSMMARGGPSPGRRGGRGSPSRRPRPLSRAERLESSGGSDSESSAFTDGGSKKRKAPKGVGKRAKNKRNQCGNCGTHVTPQWRMGPGGPRTLCNACGVRYKKGLPLTGYTEAAEAAAAQATEQPQGQGAAPGGRSPSRRSVAPSVAMSSPRPHRGSPRGEARQELQLSTADLTYNTWRH